MEERKGIGSLKGYVTSRLEQLTLKYRVFARYAPLMLEFGYDEDSNTIYIKDNRSKKIICQAIADFVCAFLIPFPSLRDWPQ
jgi:hypothetical protein